MEAHCIFLYLARGLRERVNVSYMHARRLLRNLETWTITIASDGSPEEAMERQGKA